MDHQVLSLVAYEERETKPGGGDLQEELDVKRAPRR
jgi:hypothetical protein